MSGYILIMALEKSKHEVPAQNRELESHVRLCRSGVQLCRKRDRAPDRPLLRIVYVMNCGLDECCNTKYWKFSNDVIILLMDTICEFRGGFP